ncbi:MAG: 2-C-methyl-D-erythritol 4-phosphate cytidylyltransferase [Pseudomonadota bacterium]
MHVGAVIVAGGRGTRAGGGMPKQWRWIAGAQVATHSLRAFAAHPSVEQLVLVVHPDDLESDLWPRQPEALVVAGGATRGASVQAGLRHMAAAVDTVLIHDAARPCVTQRVIDGVLKGLESGPAAAPAVAVVDALWTGKSGRVTGTASRDGLFRAQTPQGFDLKTVLRAYRQNPEGGADDVEVVRKAGVDVAITPGDDDNLKITGPDDFARAESILRARDGH